MPFANQPAAPAALDECLFYHKMEVPGAGLVGAAHAWDLRDRVEEYVGNVDLHGKTFLDVGAATGFITFEVEKRGASVVSFDLEHAGQRQLVPTARVAGSAAERAKNDRHAIEYLRQMRNAYWYAHAANRSQARAFYGNIYEIPADVGEFDVVFTGQVLVHLRDPLWALYQAAQRCRDTLVITEGMFEDDRPRAAFLSGPGTGNDDGWWHLSTKLYEEWLETIGFRIERMTTSKYPFVTPDGVVEHQIGTIVARRTQDRF